MTIRETVVRRYILVSILQVVFLVLMPTGSWGDVDTWCWEISIFSLMVLIFQLYSFRWFTVKKHLLLPTFIVLSYLFHLSHIALYLYDPQIAEQFKENSAMRRSGTIEAVTIAVRAMICIYWGAVTFLTLWKKKKSIILDTKVYQPRIVFIIIITIVGFLADASYTIYVSIIEGYGNDEANMFTTIIRPFTFLLPAGIAFILLRTTLSLKTKNFFFFLFILYKGVSMMGGYRAFALITIVLAFYFYTRVCYRIKINFKTIAIGIIFVYVGSIAMVGIRDTRHEGVSMAEIQELTSQSDVNPILNQLSEFGLTLNVTSVLLDAKHGEASGGDNIIIAFLSVVPGISGIIEDTNIKSLNTALNLQSAGGSYISDLLYDFGTYGIIPASLLFGLLFGKVFNIFESDIDRKYYNHVAFLFPVMVDFIFCIRTSMVRLPRVFVWYALIFFFFWLIFSGKGIKFKG